MESEPALHYLIFPVDGAARGRRVRRLRSPTRRGPGWVARDRSVVEYLSDDAQTAIQVSSSLGTAKQQLVTAYLNWLLEM